MSTKAIKAFEQPLLRSTYPTDTITAKRLTLQECLEKLWPISTIISKEIVLSLFGMSQYFFIMQAQILQHLCLPPNFWLWAPTYTLHVIFPKSLTLRGRFRQSLLRATDWGGTWARSPENQPFQAPSGFSPNRNLLLYRDPWGDLLPRHSEQSRMRNLRKLGEDETVHFLSKHLTLNANHCHYKLV
jgi:hypothetical protein